MKSNKVIEEMMETPVVKTLGLKEEDIINILDAHDNISMTHLLENGQLDLGNGMMVVVVMLLERVRVLRGVPYKSRRKYKLKLDIDDNIYKKIEDYYNKLQEDIL